MELVFHWYTVSVTGFSCRTVSEAVFFWLHSEGGWFFMPHGEWGWFFMPHGRVRLVFFWLHSEWGWFFMPHGEWLVFPAAQ